MSRRIELELTSARDDGTWTWRAAGARQPKGVLDGALLPSGASVGDVLRADVDTDIDGTTVTAVLPPKGKRPEPERLELQAPRRSDDLVTTSLVRERGGSRERRPRDGDRDRGRPDGEHRRDGRPRRPPAGDRPSDGRRREAGDRPPRDRRPDRADGERRPPRERPAPPSRPKAKRLRAGRQHRKEVLDALAPEQQAIAEQVLRGGVPAVRQAVDKQNEQARAEGLPVVRAEPLLALAEQLLPRLRTAEWLDRATAALVDVDELDLRDLRSVVVAADTGARDDEGRALAGQLREALGRRVDEEQSSWLNELATTLSDGRVVRALRLSSRPPKAGSPLPADLTGRLVASTAASLTADTLPDRWATVLDALSYSPVRQGVTPQSVPEKPSEELVGAVRRVADRVPQIAALFGVQATPPKRRRTGRPKLPPMPPRDASRPAAPAAPAPPAPAAEEPTPTAADPVVAAQEPSPAAPEQPAAEPSPAEPNPTAADPAVAAQQPTAPAPEQPATERSPVVVVDEETPTAPGDDAPLASTADAHPTAEPN